MDLDPTPLLLTAEWIADAPLRALWGKLFDAGFLEDDRYRGWTVICNAVSAGRSFSGDPKKTVVLRMEPECDTDAGEKWNRWLTGQEGAPALLPSAFAFWGSAQLRLNAIEWHMPIPRQAMCSSDFQREKRGLARTMVSVVCSSQCFMAGHKWRLALLRRWYETRDAADQVALYGRSGDLGLSEWYRGALPEHDKRAGIVPYRYTLAAENCEKANYATEKLWDALLTETLCFYRGCPNILEWVEPDALVLLPADLDAAVATIRSAVRADDANARYLERHLPAIRRTRCALLARWSLQRRICTTTTWVEQQPLVLVLQVRRDSGCWALDPLLSTQQVERVEAGESSAPSRHARAWRACVERRRPCLVVEDSARVRAPECLLDTLYEMYARLDRGWQWASLGLSLCDRTVGRAPASHRNHAQWWPLLMLLDDSVEPLGVELPSLGSFGDSGSMYFVSPAGAAGLLRGDPAPDLAHHVAAAVRTGRLTSRGRAVVPPRGVEELAPKGAAARGRGLVPDRVQVRPCSLCSALPLALRPKRTCASCKLRFDKVDGENPHFYSCPGCHRWMHWCAVERAERAGVAGDCDALCVWRPEVGREHPAVIAPDGRVLCEESSGWQALVERRRARRPSTSRRPPRPQKPARQSGSELHAAPLVPPRRSRAVDRLAAIPE